MSEMSRQMHEALTLLDVRPVTLDNGSLGLIVDATRLSTSPHDPLLWQLEWENDGWEHPPSGTCGPLGQVLWGIARSYQIAWPSTTGSEEPE